jgi:predicted nucleotidyltransferase
LHPLPEPVELAQRLDGALRKEGITLDALMERASEVVVFGSQASGSASEDSDWDVLVLGDFPPVHRERLDLVVVSSEQASSKQWLESELASHVAQYGIWLKGTGAWRPNARIGNETIAAKNRRLRSQAEAFGAIGHIQSPARRFEHARSLRRQLQRLELLTLNGAVPTNPELDRAWAALSREERKSRLSRSMKAWGLGTDELPGVLVQAEEASLQAPVWRSSLS